MEEKHTLIAAGIAKRFGAFAAVDQVDFLLKEDEAVGIVGPNGAGKTSSGCRGGYQI
jgi:branched-chain amino acid transport system ATP-binding protein